MTNKQSDSKKPQPSSSLDVGGDVEESVIITGSQHHVTINKGGGSEKVGGDGNFTSKNSINGFVLGGLVVVIAILIGLLIGGQKTGELLPGSAGVSSGPEDATATQTATPTHTATSPVEEAALAPATEAPTATSTATPTPVPPVPVGEDWLKGCISTFWIAYPSTVLSEERGDGCWKEPVGAFSAENGDLDFLAERDGNGPAEVYGLFSPLPERGKVTFTIRLRDLTNADLQMGIYSQPDVNSTGLLMTILSGDVNRRSFVQKNPFNYETIQGTVALDQNNGYSITFSFDALSVISEVNPSVFVTNPVSLPHQKWLFLGYKGLRSSYRVEGTFLQLEISQ